MKISDVLADKGHRVVSVRPSKAADALPMLFNEHNIASVVVIDGMGRLLGIVTDRLYMKALAHHGRRVLELTAADIMETPAPACAPADSVSQALRVMTDRRVRHLVVLDDGKLNGVVSIGDLVKSRLKDVEIETRVLRDIALGHLAAGE
jgi:CBS domain-containing protein